MSARRTTARFSLALALVASFAVGGAAASASAAGEPDGLYSTSSPGEGAANGFVQLDKTDATATPVGPVSDTYFFLSVEVVNGLGYAIGYEADAEDAPFQVFTWDITSGAVLTAVVATAPIDGEFSLEALDTTNAGVLLTYLQSGDIEWLASIDPATGVVTPLVDLDTAPDGRIFEGIATNPVTGVTYLLADYDDGIPAYSSIDIATGGFGESVFFPQFAETLGSGWFSEGDFDATGTLWFTYSGDVGVARTDGPAEVGVDAVELGDPDIVSKAITIGQTVVAPAPAPEPQLAATGFPVAPVVGGAAVLLAAGLGMIVLRRRATV
ncbi:hypothetical protein M2152_000450 [Microbacteriaceae bacterium SG_E_30_P1]|uniref:Uncharacterized protein n=1 Tax=Antiquaquibacter oligotrophicus TaxID=2880260 RepID=A0ABT6KJW3_9MICO|nr:hypothetical protein [Antiquaquibacter oligotrophicus]MDH6180268.1 hypothetical protein [Antiquaquibacter oligotrophicus]UDF13985.1 hypothetical protein LH407_03775 [Antiquaquibacter oligotrophicus]